MKRGLAVGKDKYGSLGMRNVNDSTQLGSVDSKMISEKSMYISKICKMGLISYFHNKSIIIFWI